MEQNMKLTLSDGEPIIISETEMQMILQSKSQLVVLKNGNIINKAHIVSAVKTSDELKNYRKISEDNLAFPNISEETQQEKDKIKQQRLKEFRERKLN